MIVAPARRDKRELHGGRDSKQRLTSMCTARRLTAATTPREGAAMQGRVTSAIVFVDDMARAVAFYRDIFGFPLKFESPAWSEFSMGSVSLVLLPANGAEGQLALGLTVPDVSAFAAALEAQGVSCTCTPNGAQLGQAARFVDPQQVSWSVTQD
jgi:catechol 2,3-dioxygenase-like lactoylglutathione lyase family enzyme